MISAVPRQGCNRALLEGMVKESGIDWTIAQPGALTREPRTRRDMVLPEPSQWRNGIISRPDVAGFLV